MSFTKADKEELLEQLSAVLESRVADFTRIARETARGATHEEAKPEDDKDTRALEQTYLARGQAERVAVAEHELQLFRSMKRRAWESDEPIASGALVTLTDESETERSFLLLPLGAGLKLEKAGIPVQVITPTSPLGEALLGQAEDDSVEVFIGGARRDWDVVAVL